MKFWLFTNSSRLQIEVLWMLLSEAYATTYRSRRLRFVPFKHMNSSSLSAIVNLHLWTFESLNLWTLHLWTNESVNKLKLGCAAQVTVVVYSSSRMSSRKITVRISYTDNWLIYKRILFKRVTMNVIPTVFEYHNRLFYHLYFYASSINSNMNKKNSINLSF